MVQKLCRENGLNWDEFESSVVLDGTKTYFLANRLNVLFESSVVLDGTKTPPFVTFLMTEFESSVVLDGTKTVQHF